MHIVYSASANSAEDQIADLDTAYLSERSYNSLCEKYSNELAAIRKYFPDWQPLQPSRHYEYQLTAI